MSERRGKRRSNLVFGALFALSCVLFGRVVWPFLMPVLLGGFLAVLFMPAHDLLRRVLCRHRALCAGLATVSVFLLICVPVVVISYLVLRELLGVADAVQKLLAHVDVREELSRLLPAGVGRHLLFTAASAEGAVLTALSNGAELARQLLGAGTELGVDLFLMTIALYYFFLDGRRLVSTVARLLPLEQRYFDAFAQEFKDVTFAIMYGNTLTAMVQGAFGFVGLFVAGVPHPVLWAVAMAAFALIPLGGTALVWAPMGVVLWVTGSVWQGVFLLVFGALVVSTVDNLIRPRLCGMRMTLHPLMVFLSIFGGLAVFGLMGLLVGPLIAALFMTTVRIYRRDFLRRPASA